MSSSFPTTNWNLICSLRDGDLRRVREALSVLGQVYWPPLYAYARRRGLDRESAEDVTQGFFLHLLEREALAKADRSRSRFRSFLLGSFRNFLAHERNREWAKKRRPDRPLLSLDATIGERFYRLEPVDDLTPDEVYERRWAQVVGRRAWRQLERKQQRPGSRERFRILGRYVIESDSSLSYQEAAGTIGITMSAIKVAVHRLRRQFGECLQAEVTPTLANPADAADEVRHILRLIERSHGGLDAVGA